MNEVRVGDCIIRCWPDQRHICTVLPDGSEVPAAPNHTPSDIALAHELGYGGDTWRMTLEHEVGHTIVAVYLYKCAYSHTLWWVAHPRPIGPKDAESFESDENIVLDFQRKLSGKEPCPVWSIPMMTKARALIARLMGEAA